MTTAEALAFGRRSLAALSIETAALDARLLLQQVLGVTHEHIIAEPAQVLSVVEAQAFQVLIARRMRFEPVAKILGVKEFYGRVFSVSQDVLDPRPDTEAVIALALRLVRDNASVKVLDLGSGSGAIMCTLLAELPLATGVAVDVAHAARDHTLQNAQTLGVGERLIVVGGSWFDEVFGRFDLIVSNPPYIERDAIAALAPDVRLYDPHLALDGGQDGLECYRHIASRASDHLERGGRVVLEIGAGQADEIIRIFNAHGFTFVDQCFDLSGQVRGLAFGCV